MNKSIIFYSILFFSTTLLLSSFFYIGTKDTNNQQVMGAKDSEDPQLPKNSSIVSQDESDNTKQLSYTTDLSRDQVLHFYKELGNLENWKQITSESYTTNKKTISIKVEKESEGRNLVTVEYK